MEHVVIHFHLRLYVCLEHAFRCAVITAVMWRPKEGVAARPRVPDPALPPARGSPLVHFQNVLPHNQCTAAAGAGGGGVVGG